MKKYLILLILTLVLTGAGCSNKKDKLIEDQENKINELGQKVEKLSNMVASSTTEIKNKPPQIIIKEKEVTKTIPNQTDQNKNFNIETSEISPYLTGIGNIKCFNDDGSYSGSGSLWNFGWSLGYSVLTNRHVISGGSCSVRIDDPTKDTYHNGFFRIDNENIKSWNNSTDVATLKILYSLNFEEGADATPEALQKTISGLNFSISYLKKCPNEMPQGSPVVIVGYPAYAQQQNTSLTPRIITNGIISGFDSSVAPPLGQLPYFNYFVSAKIDSGNSGGLAFSKNKDGLCILGIPTWLTVGNYETQGVIQNINNVMYIK